MAPAVEACAAAPLVSFSETVKHSLGSGPPLLVVHEAPALSIPIIQDAMDHAVHYTSHALVYRFNGLWPRLSDLHSWVSSEWNHLLKEGAIIYPCAKGFFIVIFVSVEDKDQIFRSGAGRVCPCSPGPLLLMLLGKLSLRL